MRRSLFSYLVLYTILHIKKTNAILKLVLFIIDFPIHIWRRSYDHQFLKIPKCGFAISVRIRMKNRSEINKLQQLFCLIDVNECQVQPKLCAPNGNCVNKNGSYECRCKPGWTGDNCQKGEIIFCFILWKETIPYMWVLLISYKNLLKKALDFR